MPNSTTPKLSDTQLVILSTASQREDGFAVLPEKLKGGAAKAVVTRLLTLEFLKEVRVKRDQPTWRTDEEEMPLGLKITRAGSAAIGVEEQGSHEAGARSTPKPPRKPRTIPVKAAASPEPRAGSKQAQIIALMGRTNGATLDDMVEATGWLPHTTRAALTGLRQKGYDLAKSKNPKGQTAYRIEREGAAATRVSAEQLVGQ